MKSTALCLLLIITPSVVLTSCMTARQVRGLERIAQAERDGRLAPEEAQEMRDALSTGNFLNDILMMLGFGGTGVATYVATNLSRNRQRRKRGEPVRPEDLNPASTATTT